MDINISLASTGAVKVPGYEQLLRFGYTKNRGVYRLNVSATGEWSGLALRVFWHVPGGKDPPSSLVVDGTVEVPALVTSISGDGCITFEGTDGEKRITSADLRYRVSANSGTQDGTAPEPGADSWQQFVEAVREDAKIASESSTKAQDAAGKAEQALSDTLAAKENALESIAQAKTDAVDKITSASQPTLEAAQRAKENADAAASSANAAEQAAQASSANAAEATRQAGLAAQAAESKGYLYLEDHNNSGTLSLVIADNIADDITLRDNGAGILEVVYT